MMDRTKGTPLRVSKDDRAGPYLIVPAQQVSEVRAVLDRAGIAYWVDNISVSMDSGPALTVVNFKKGANPVTIQTVLDQA
jgi:hypothetical protein